jgi:CDP-diacylglycerol--serine O-phosphatidyltransferase
MSKRSLPISMLIPNMVTILALCAALSSIRFALREQWEVSVILILLAAFMDGMDGRLARLLNASSKFGAELDSLADFINFGVAPSIVLYLWQDQGVNLHGFGWTLVLIFSTCMALRLARFNASLEEEDVPAWKDQFFTGIPAPVAASLIMLPMVITFIANEHFATDKLPIAEYAISIYMFVMSILVISTFPTISIKKMTINRSYAPLILFIFIILAGLLVIRPWITLAFIGVIYLMSIPISIACYHKCKNNDCADIND